MSDTKCTPVKDVIASVQTKLAFFFCFSLSLFIILVIILICLTFYAVFIVTYIIRLLLMHNLNFYWYNSHAI